MMMLQRRTRRESARPHQQDAADVHGRQQERLAGLRVVRQVPRVVRGLAVVDYAVEERPRAEVLRQRMDTWLNTLSVFQASIVCSAGIRDSAVVCYIAQPRLRIRSGAPPAADVDGIWREQGSVLCSNHFSCSRMCRQEVRLLGVPCLRLLSDMGCGRIARLRHRKCIRKTLHLQGGGGAGTWGSSGSAAW